MVAIQSNMPRFSAQESVGIHESSHNVFNDISLIDISFGKNPGHNDMASTPHELVNFGRGSYDTTGVPKPLPKPR